MGNRRARQFQKAEQERLDWQQVETQGRHISESANARGIGFLRLQVICIPSFEPGNCWEVRSLGEVWRLFRSDASAEGEWLMGYEELEVEAAILRRYMKLLGILSLPLGLSEEWSMGLDGTQFQLAISSRPNIEVRFRWSESPPVEWAPLGVIVREMIEVFGQLPVKQP